MNPLGASWYTREGLGLSFGVLLLLRVGWIIDRIDSPIIDIRVKRMFEKLGLTDGLPLGSSRKWISSLLLVRCFVCRTCTHIDLRGLVVRASIDLLARANNDIRWYGDVLVLRGVGTHIDLRGLVVRASIDLLARANNDIRWYGELGRVDLHEVIGLR